MRQTHMSAEWRKRSLSPVKGRGHEGDTLAHGEAAPRRRMAFASRDASVGNRTRQPEPAVVTFPAGDASGIVGPALVR